MSQKRHANLVLMCSVFIGTSERGKFQAQRFVLDDDCTLGLMILIGYARITRKEKPMQIRLVHEGAISPDLLYQKREPEWFFGRCVKIAFESSEGKVEWMWVQVLKLEGHTLSGNLVSNPLFCTHLAYGDAITLSRLQIAAVDL